MVETETYLRFINTVLNYYGFGSSKSYEFDKDRQTSF